MTHFTRTIDEFQGKIDFIIFASEKLLGIMNQEDPIPERNLIAYAFLRKTVRLAAALKLLVATGYEEEAQILARALIETRINCEYFLLMAKDDWKNATGRVMASLMLDKMKALRATNFMLGDRQVDREKWEDIEKQIRDSCGEALFNELKQYGFSGLSLEARAVKTENKELYDLAYRMYSRNAHATDIHEQLGRKLVGDAFVGTEQTMLPAVLEAVWKCAGLVVDKCNDWLGDPLGVKGTGSSEASL